MPLALSYLGLLICTKSDDSDTLDWELVMFKRSYTGEPFSLCLVEEWREPSRGGSRSCEFLRGRDLTGAFRGEPVVVKVAQSDYPESTGRLQHEGRVYDGLKAVQGAHIPECLGCFTRCGPPTDGRRAALVTLYYGRTIMCEVEDRLRPTENSWAGMDGYDKRLIISSAIAVHKHGFSLGELGPENLILTDTNAFLVGLADGEAHDCGHHGRLTHGALAPVLENFGCSELYYLCLRLRIWFLRSITFMGKTYNTERFYPFPWRLAAKAPSDVSREVAIEYAICAIHDYAVRYSIDEGEELNALMAKEHDRIVADFVNGTLPDEAEPYGIQSPEEFREFPASTLVERNKNEKSEESNLKT